MLPKEKTGINYSLKNHLPQHSTFHPDDQPVCQVAAIGSQYSRMPLVGSFHGRSNLGLQKRTGKFPAACRWDDVPNFPTIQWNWNLTWNIAGLKIKMKMKTRVWMGHRKPGKLNMFVWCFHPWKRKKHITQTAHFCVVPAVSFTGVHSEDSEHVEIGWNFQVHLQNQSWSWGWSFSSPSQRDTSHHTKKTKHDPIVVVISNLKNHHTSQSLP